MGTRLIGRPRSTQTTGFTRLADALVREAYWDTDNNNTTLVMKVALTDSMVERASGRTVEGGERSEVTELWTFMRARGGNWLLSAIQQT